MNLIELNDVGLKFNVRCHGRISLKEYLLKGLFWPSKSGSLKVQALDGISFSVAEGERLGIVGHNGAGKSTLLKLLAGIYPPTAGERRVHGKISSLFEIALGFELDANGWDNIIFRGYLMGETPKTIRDKVTPIAEFSELGKFLDMPVRYYSSGMLVRLAFAISTAINPEILIIDEVLSAGDIGFQEKARSRMRDLLSSAKAAVIVSHDMQSLSLLCDRVMWLDHGQVKQIGDAEEVIEAYVNHQKSGVANPLKQAA